MSHGTRSSQQALCISGAGNRFLLIDGRTAGLPPNAAALARLACAAREDGSPPGQRFVPDGLLWVIRGRRAENLRMVLHNADGTRPEACGNGLRCLVHWAVESGLLAGGAARVETDAGERDVRWERTPTGPRVEVSLGRPRRLEPIVLAQAEGAPQFARVDLGNPHAVACVSTLDGVPLESLARSLQRSVPGGTNVELVARAGDGLTMRVWERGVGETEACGTGSAAAAWIAAEHWGLEWPVTVRQPGGILTIDRDAAEQLWLSGPVRTHGTASFTGAAWATCSTS